MSISATSVSTPFDQVKQRDTSEPSFAGKRCQYPSLYQINTRVWIRDLSRNLGRPATLDDIPEEQLGRLAQKGFDCIWLLGVWQTGLAGRRVSREHLNLQIECRQVLPNLQEDDICGSCFAITLYAAHSDFGGNSALERLRTKLHNQGMRLLLDFVPNHTALDHPWVQTHPNFYVRGTEEQLRREPQNYIRLETSSGSTILAYGRDPYFAGWPDTLQLNYAEPTLQEAMRLELLNVASLCDGVRCDMAMLILPEVFERTWGLRAEPFWPNAILTVRSHKPKFLFMAEVYWDLEWTLQQQGFDYTYDKRLYDRLRDGHARPVRDHFRASMQFQRKSARFLENHDEPRAATTFAPAMHRAAAVLTYLCPGMRFFHDGQFEGKTKKISMHVDRAPIEPVELAVRDFYDRLLVCVHAPTVRNDGWQLLDCSPAWDGNGTWDCFICFAWDTVGELPLVVVTNYAPNQSQCYLQLPFDDLCGHQIHLQDLMGSALYERDGDELVSRGLYLDMPPWGYHVFKLTTLESVSAAAENESANTVEEDN
jgi:alpha amylase-like protein